MMETCGPYNTCLLGTDCLLFLGYQSCMQSRKCAEELSEERKLISSVPTFWPYRTKSQGRLSKLWYKVQGESTQ